jgi:hypothetical protein
MFESGTRQTLAGAGPLSVTIAEAPCSARRWHRQVEAGKSLAPHRVVRRYCFARQSVESDFGTISHGGTRMSEAADEQRLTGGCQCGAVRYEIVGVPTALYVCHCRECRKQSSSAFGISVIVRRADFRLNRGRVRTWSRPTDSGRTLDCAYCPDCGSRLWHQAAGEGETLSVKGGSLDEPVDLRKAVHVWTSRKLPGVIIPEDAVQFAQEPE